MNAAEQFINLDFDEESHTYRHNGKVVPSVTQILKDLGFIDDEWFTEESRNRGNNVHRACELLDNGNLDWLSVSDEIRGYVAAYESFLSESKCGILEVEQRLFNENLFVAGTVDRIIKLNGRTTVLDIKSGAHQKWWKYQVAGYARMKFGKAPVNTMSLELRADGKYSVRNYNDHGHNVAVFESCVNVYHAKNSC